MTHDIIINLNQYMRIIGLLGVEFINDLKTMLTYSLINMTCDVFFKFHESTRDRIGPYWRKSSDTIFLSFYVLCWSNEIWCYLFKHIDSLLALLFNIEKISLTISLQQKYIHFTRTIVQCGFSECQTWNEKSQYKTDKSKQN